MQEALVFPDERRPAAAPCASPANLAFGMAGSPLWPCRLAWMGATTPMGAGVPRHGQAGVARPLAARRRTTAGASVAVASASASASAGDAPPARGGEPLAGPPPLPSLPTPTPPSGSTVAVVGEEVSPPPLPSTEPTVQMVDGGGGGEGDGGSRRPRRGLRVLRGVDWQSGASLHLHPAKDVARPSTAPAADGGGVSDDASPTAADTYIRCRKCTTCYLYTPAAAGMSVVCARCGDTFAVSARTLFTRATSVGVPTTEERPVTPGASGRGRAGGGGGGAGTRQAGPRSLPPAMSAKARAAVVAATAAGRAMAGTDGLHCEHFATCSGCTLERSVGHPPVLAATDAYFREELGYAPGLSTATAVGPTYGWRTHAKLAVRPGASKGSPPVVGLFERGSHSVVAIPRCAVHHPAINSGVAEVVRAVVAAGVDAYDEATHEGLLRYVVMNVQRSTGAVQLVLVLNAGSWKEAAPAAPRLVKALWAAQQARARKASDRRDGGGSGRGDHPAAGAVATASAGAVAGAVSLHAPSSVAATDANGPNADLEATLFPPAVVWHSITIHYNPSTSNVILNPQPFRYDTLHGPPTLIDRLHGVRVHFAPASFRQANLDAFEVLLGQLLPHLPERSVITEYCAGVGAIGLVALVHRRLSSLVASDINPAAAWPFRRSVSMLPAHVRPAASYVVGAGGELAHLIGGAEVVVVDPPRGGLDGPLLDALAEAPGRGGGLRRVVYLSCGAASLRRDAIRLVRAGWVIAHAEAAVFFPGTDAIETLVVFDRRTYAPAAAGAGGAPRAKSGGRSAGRVDRSPPAAGGRGGRGGGDRIVGGAGRGGSTGGSGGWRARLAARDVGAVSAGGAAHRSGGGALDMDGWDEEDFYEDETDDWEWEVVREPQMGRGGGRS
ncbi:hypothetical protein MMPV_000316 [Pyropia vietnamensis]